MELTLKGFDNWSIDTAHGKNGKRWVDVYKKTGPRYDDWEQFGNFESLDEALDCLIEEGLEMTEDQVCEIQEEVPGNIYAIPQDMDPEKYPQWREAYGL